MVKNILLALALLLFCSDISAFQSPQATSRVVPVTWSKTTALNVFGSKKKESNIEEESKYWQGEWVCKDCGYIYNRVSEML